MSLAPPLTPACFKTMDTGDGQAFIKSLAHFVRTHERALANALQLRRQPPKHTPSSPTGSAAEQNASAPARRQSLPSPTPSSQPSGGFLAAAFSLPSLNLASQPVKPAKLALTPHHLFYLLSRFEELGIAVGPLNVRLESIHAESSAGNYVSFLGQSQRRRGRPSDRDSIHSVSSLRSVASGLSSLWSSLGLGPSSAASAAKIERAKAAIEADLKYLYSAFTKLPCLRLAPDRRAGLIRGFEEFPFDTAVPLWAFKNVSSLEIVDVDFRQFFGWDRLAEQLRHLVVKRAAVDDPADLLINIVLDDMDRRRRRSSRTLQSPVMPLTATASSPSLSHHPDMARSISTPNSPKIVENRPGASGSPKSIPMVRGGSEGSRPPLRPRPRSRSGSHASVVRPGSTHGHLRSGSNGGGAIASGGPTPSLGPQRLRRSGSGSSTSSTRSNTLYRGGSSSNLLAIVQLPASKWRSLRHLSMADNGLTTITANSLAPLANTLHSLDLSSNLFTQIPDSLATLTNLRALNLSGCMIDSLRTLSRNPLPAITALNLRSNRLGSLAGIERLPALERVDLRDNRLADPTELARLTAIPEVREIWVADNPFTRTHAAYRVTIFNLFRNTPGYLDDPLIDASGPGYGERRQLASRVVQPTVVPDPVALSISANAADDGADSSVRPPSTPPTPTPTPQIATDSSADAARHTPPALSPAAVELSPPTSHYTSQPRSVRRRKGPRRRIVELSRSDIPSPEPDPSLQHSSYSVDNVKTSPLQPRSSADTQQAHYLSHAAPHAAPPEPLISTAAHGQIPVPGFEADPLPLPSSDFVAAPKKPDTTSRDWDIDSEIYRKKIEALRNEVGSGWLSVLSEGGWDQTKGVHAIDPDSTFSAANTLTPSLTSSNRSSNIIGSGGRTLG